MRGVFVGGNFLRGQFLKILHNFIKICLQMYKARIVYNWVSNTAHLLVEACDL